MKNYTGITASSTKRITQGSLTVPLKNHTGITYSSITDERVTQGSLVVQFKKSHREH